MGPQPQPDSPAFQTPRWKRNLISALIIIHMIIIPLGSNDRQAGFRTPVQQFLMPYLIGTRLFQYWALFSPEPRRYTANYRAEITYLDGSRKVWRRPAAPNWDFFARHLAYNFQKWDLVSNALDRPMLLWPSLVHYLLRAYPGQFGNPPKKIEFIRAQAQWPPPNPVGYVQSDINLLKWEDVRLFTYWVDEDRYQQ